ncbi:MAG: NAD(+)/NADH kinase [Eubacteriales bacterium]|nr:NAD(+)/NADH kinase [Eubacteriales bacterium]
MIVGLFANPQRDHNYNYRKQLTQLFADRGVGVVTEVADFDQADLFISLGGDGTFLSLAQIESARDKACIGVNLGSVGFLTEIDPQYLSQAVDQICRGQYSLDQRLMLTMQVLDDQGQVLHTREALNDVVVMRLAGGRIVTVDFWINSNPVERISGDGLIISTPTGSTAYSLAAGGPIVHPGMDVILITPICPHTLHNRSYLAPGDATIELRLSDDCSSAMVSADGKQSIKIEQGTIKIQKSRRPFTILRLGDDRFYQALPQKIQERGMLR